MKCSISSISVSCAVPNPLVFCVKSLAVSEDGRSLWGWGSNDMGQLGPNAEENVTVPTKIPVGGNDTRIVGISAGYAHTAVLTDKGAVLTFGRANNGQLGRGLVKDDDSVPAPVRVAEAECRTGKL